MSIIISGDTHIPIDIRKLNTSNVQRVADGIPTHVIIAGDFGLIWSNNPEDAQELYWKKWLEEKPWETLVCLGNHENYERIYALPMEERYGAPMYKYSNKIWIFQHGNVYTVENKTFFVFGGAASVDKANRTNRISWWEEEIPTQGDYRRAAASLETVEGKVDYVITHTIPMELLEVYRERGLLLDFGSLGSKSNDPTIAMIDSLKDDYLKEYKNWFHGHFHLDGVFQTSSGRIYHSLFDNLYKID